MESSKIAQFSESTHALLCPYCNSVYLEQKKFSVEWNGNMTITLRCTTGHHNMKLYIIYGGSAGGVTMTWIRLI